MPFMRGIMTVPDDDATADMFEQAMETMAAAGWEHYEVSNWSREPGRGSVHNMLYWRNGEYLGIGAGSHGRIGFDRTMRHLLPRTYIDAIDQGSGVSNTDVIDERMAMGETMMLGLRLLREGVRFDEFASRHGVGLLETFGDVIRSQIEIGLLDQDDQGVRLTHRGLLFANDVCGAYLP